jgi:ribonuclease E
LRDAVKRDRARTKILRTSPFGLIEMTRQRIRPSLKRSVYRECPGCTGAGVVKTPESLSLEVVRLLMLASQTPDVAQVNVTVAEDVASYLNNRKRREISALEEEAHIAVEIFGKETSQPEQVDIECLDAAGRVIPFDYK